MKIIVFAGGVGTRLWPVSRKNTPKQFEKLIGDKSTLQQAIDNLQPDFPYSDIFIATNKRYEETIREQLPQIPHDNFIFEPEMRDVGPAIGLVSVSLADKFNNEPIAILWSDHMVKNVGMFKACLHKAEEMVKSQEANFTFIAQKPRFANQNMGWIEVMDGKSFGSDMNVYNLKRFRYRPKLADAIAFFKNENYVWNLGYFVTTPSYLTSLYQTYAPDMYKQLAKIKDAIGTNSYENVINTIYPKLEKISFDDLILVKMKRHKVFVISTDLGWSDVGAWESLKEALTETEEENVTRGKVLLQDSEDSLAFNYNDQLLVGIDLKEMLVVNTGDVVLVCPKTSVPKIKKLVESMAGTDNEHLT